MCVSVSLSAPGDFIHNSTTNKRTRVPRLVRIHSDELEDIPSAVSAGVEWGRSTSQGNMADWSVNVIQ